MKIDLQWDELLKQVQQGELNGQERGALETAFRNSAALEQGNRKVCSNVELVKLLQCEHFDLLKAMILYIAEEGLTFAERDFITRVIDKGTKL